MHPTLFRSCFDSLLSLTFGSDKNDILTTRDNIDNKLFGDKHPGLGIEGGCYDVNDLAEIFRLGIETGYFSDENNGSASIEMRRLPGVSSEESFEKYYQAVQEAWTLANK